MDISFQRYRGSLVVTWKSPLRPALLKFSVCCHTSARECEGLGCPTVTRRSVLEIGLMTCKIQQVRRPVHLQVWTTSTEFGLHLSFFDVFQEVIFLMRRKLELEILYNHECAVCLVFDSSVLHVSFVFASSLPCTYRTRKHKTEEA